MVYPLSFVVFLHDGRHDGGKMPQNDTLNQVRIVQILPATAVDKAFDYKVPYGMPCEIGSVVTIPLLGRKVIGVVWFENAPETPPAKIKDIISVLPFAPLSQDYLHFIEKMAHYNFADKGSVLKLGFAIDFKEPKRVSKKPTLYRLPKPDHLKRALNDDQFKAAKLLSLHVQQGGYKPFLLDGVTGSGKTEVYFEAIATAIKDNKQALILLPEIALSNAFMHRFGERFGTKPYLWHSSVTPANRKMIWKGVATNDVKVVIGARSALFLPFQSLGLIVVDEEHDASYKQEEGVIYHARDMAVLRAHTEDIPIILASATPSLETMQNVWSEKYQHIVLASRYHNVSMPDIEIIDLKKDKPARQKFLAPRIIDRLKDVLAKGEQALLFLNRRGYAPLTICRTCGHRVECPRCTAWLVEHRSQKKLSCHHCGYETALPQACPSCQTIDSLTACGPGIERIAEEVREALPDARTLLLASDITNTPQKIESALEQISSQNVDIIIGTQIVAKGHHMPQLTHVTVVDGDLGLAGSDLRASERTFQLLHQVSGRAGRETKSGEVFIQTFNPEHPVMKLLKDNNRQDFMIMERDQRARAHMPPFGRLAGVIISGLKEHMVKETAIQFSKHIPRVDGIKVLGPAPAPMYRIRGKYRYRFLVQADKKIDLSKFMQAWIDAYKMPSSIKITVDIDPQNFN